MKICITCEDGPANVRIEGEVEATEEAFGALADAAWGSFHAVRSMPAHADASDNKSKATLRLSYPYDSPPSFGEKVLTVTSAGNNINAVTSVMTVIFDFDTQTALKAANRISAGLRQSIQFDSDEELELAEKLLKKAGVSILYEDRKKEDEGAQKSIWLLKVGACSRILINEIAKNSGMSADEASDCVRLVDGGEPQKITLTEDAVTKDVMSLLERLGATVAM